MQPYVDDSDFRLYQGDALEVLRGLPDESVHCCVTSPPYWGLRDYGTGEWEGGDSGCDHVASRATQNLDKLGERYAGGGHKASSEGAIVAQFRDVCGKCSARRVDKQLGLEPTPEEYVANMVALFREVRRVLRRDGTCWLNLGDSYAGGGGGNYGSGLNVSTHKAN
ncbi:MAG TPA: DNA methyltransferase, partial [Egibacteraceae bacterium]|nr:DNA methyltransferase [Egibacteraceae bacterium]